jgi:hypothetical protein
MYTLNYKGGNFGAKSAKNGGNIGAEGAKRVGIWQRFRKVFLK